MPDRHFIKKEKAQCQLLRWMVYRASDALSILRVLHHIDHSLIYELLAMGISEKIVSNSSRGEHGIMVYKLDNRKRSHLIRLVRSRRSEYALGLLLVHADGSLLVRKTNTVLAGLLDDLCLVEARQLLGGLDVTDILGVAFNKNDVDLLERAAGRLRIEKVDDGEEDGVEDGEDQVRAPAAVARAAQHHRRDHDDEEVPQPVGYRRGSVGLGAGLERVDLGRVQPRQRKPGGTEESDVSLLCGWLAACYRKGIFL